MPSAENTIQNDAKAKDIAIGKGLDRGKEQALQSKRNTAKELLLKGIDPEILTAVTVLSLEEIKEMGSDLLP